MHINIPFDFLMNFQTERVFVSTGTEDIHSQLSYRASFLTIKGTAFLEEMLSQRSYRATFLTIKGTAFLYCNCIHALEDVTYF